MDARALYDHLTGNWNMSRREAMVHMAKAFGAASLAPILGSCGNSSGGSSIVVPSMLQPSDLRGKIDHIVFMMMENRSFDHYFGSLSLPKGAGGEGRTDVDGLTGAETNNLPTGKPVPTFKMDNYCNWDPPHYFEAGRIQMNGGAMDQFVANHYLYNAPFQDEMHFPGLEEVAREAMGRYDRSDIPMYYGLADEFVLCQRWHSSQLGSTYPNRYYVHAGTASGQKCNDLGLLLSGGITSRTVYHMLNDLGVSWKYYYTDLPFTAFYTPFLTEAVDVILARRQRLED
ncbi:MAG: hypothetical protein K8I02_09880, partial [Candidatus Methylomirabilis sp.]|nr:hypothetical protein [Deltaproteobacteria bacterium]